MTVNARKQSTHSALCLSSIHTAGVVSSSISCGRLADELRACTATAVEVLPAAGETNTLTDLARVGVSMGVLALEKLLLCGRGVGGLLMRS